MAGDAPFPSRSFLVWWLHLLSFPALLGIVLVYGTASLINGGAAMALVPSLVERPFLQRAHARTDGTDAAAVMVVVAPLAGVMADGWGWRRRC